MPIPVRPRDVTDATFEVERHPCGACRPFGLDMKRLAELQRMSWR